MSPFVLSLLLALGAPPASPGGPPADVDDPPGLSLAINLPESRLEVLEGGQVIRSWPATIGAASHPTPTGSYRIDRIVWNPWWNPPDSPWARGEEKTPPGPANPMGRAKLRFSGLLFVHGTANEAALGSAASHGCIRIANEHVLELARLLATRTAAIEERELAAVEADPGRTRAVDLPGDGVPLRIRYRLVEEADGGVVRHPDPYGLGLRPHEKWLLDRDEERTGREGREERGAPATPPPGPPGA